MERGAEAHGFEIRRMRITDVAEVALLERHVFPDAWSADSFLAEVERRAEIGYPVVVRSEEGELLGYAVAWFIADEVHVGNIAIAPGHRGRSLGALLLSHVLEEGKRRGHVFATLEVRPSNEAALALYERFGFRKVAVRKSYYRDNQEDAWVLALALDSSAEDRLA